MSLHYLVKLEMLIGHVLPLSCYRTKLQNLFNLSCDPQICQILANMNSSSCSLYVIDGPSVCLSVCLSSVTLVHPTQAIAIFGNISMPCGTLAILDLCIKNFTEIVPGEPLRRGS